MDPNPLVPNAYDVMWAAALLTPIALSIVALVSVARSHASLTAAQILVWLLLILFIPLLGAIAWLVAGRPRTAVPAAP